MNNTSSWWLHIAFQGNHEGMLYSMSLVVAGPLVLLHSFLLANLHYISKQRDSYLTYYSQLTKQWGGGLVSKTT